MCLACEEQEYFFRLWCADFLARGEMPPGVTAEDLEALGLPLPKPPGDGSEPRSNERQAAVSRYSRQHVCLRQSGRMTDLTSLTLADARDRLRGRELSAVELADAHLAAMETARALNAYVLETPDQARAMARAADARLKAGDARPLEGIALGIKDLFATKDVRTTACSHILDNFLPTYEFDRQRQPLARRRGDARQAQQRRVRHGLVERDLVLRPGDLAVAAKGSEHAAGSGRLVGRLGRGGGGGALPRCNRHRYRRLDPPARGLHRHRRHQADLRPLLALGHRGVCVLARPGRAVRAHRARRRHPAHVDGRA